MKRTQRNIGEGHIQMYTKKRHLWRLSVARRKGVRGKETMQISPIPTRYIYRVAAAIFSSRVKIFPVSTYCFRLANTTGISISI